MPTIQVLGRSVMLMGCFCSAGLGTATLCRNKMKFVDYVQVLNDHVIPSMNFFFPEAEGVFLEDNAIIHRVKMKKE